MLNTIFYVRVDKRCAKNSVQVLVLKFFAANKQCENFFFPCFFNLRYQKSYCYDFPHFLITKIVTNTIKSYWLAGMLTPLSPTSTSTWISKPPPQKKKKKKKKKKKSHFGTIFFLIRSQNIIFSMHQIARFTA